MRRSRVRGPANLVRLPSLELLSLILVVSELALMISKRAARVTGKDRFTLPLLWLVIILSIWLGFELRARIPSGGLPAPYLCYWIGLVLFVAGLFIRWAAIFHLGRFFTVDIAIAKDHELITTGPYRFVRHPSYTGTFLIFLGFGLCTLNFYSLLAIFVPVSIAFLWRIHVEETALRENFGDRYVAYAARTRRVIPFLY